MSISPISRVQTTLAETAYERLRKSIVTLELVPGQMIHETEIAEMFQISRTPVREAFMLLKNEGMVDILPQKGVRVTLISRRKLKETAFVRISVERCALEQVVHAWQPSQPFFREVEQQAKAEILIQKKAIAQTNCLAFLESDIRFHKLLIGTLENETLMDVYTTLSDYLNRARYLEITEEDHQLDVVKQHRELLNAIIRKDKVKVNRIFLRHVDREQVDCVLMNHYAQYFTD